jgi:hypothetical protein
MKLWALCTSVALGLGAAFVTSAAVADAKSEVVTAWTHADLASKADDLSGVTMHLHHVLNCLVGPGGNGFDAKQINPCANAGNGAIPDTKDATKKKALQAAADKTRSGLAATTVANAKKTANAVAAMLKVDE